MRIKPKLKEDLKRYLLKKQKEEDEKIVITSSHKLSSKEKIILYSKFPELKGKDLQEVVDPSLLAGISIRKGSRIVEMSLRQRIESLQESAHEAT